MRQTLMTTTINRSVDRIEWESEQAIDRSIAWAIRIRRATEICKRMIGTHIAQHKSNKQHKSKWNEKKRLTSYRIRYDQSTRISLRIPTHHIKQSWLSGRRDRKTQSGLKKMWREKTLTQTHTQRKAWRELCVHSECERCTRAFNWLSEMETIFMCHFFRIPFSFQWSVSISSSSK